MRAFTARHQIALLASIVLGLFACAGLGFGASSGEPTLPADVAGELASKSDEVAEAADSGDQCDAAHKADELLMKLDERSGELAPAIVAEVRSVGEQLAGQLSCEEKEKKPKPEKPPGNAFGREKHGEGGD